MPDPSHLTARSAAVPDPLAEIDTLLQNLADAERAAAEQIAAHDAARTAGAVAFSEVCDRHVRPVMEAALGRLRKGGGGGIVVERAANLTLQQDHRLTLWMSLHGPIDGPPREDRHPYLQLDAEQGRPVVAVSEGDMWRGRGGRRSGRAGEWPIADITDAVVEREIVAILRRSVG